MAAKVTKIDKIKNKTKNLLRVFYKAKVAYFYAINFFMLFNNKVFPTN